MATFFKMGQASHQQVASKIFRYENCMGSCSAESNNHEVRGGLVNRWKPPGHGRYGGNCGIQWRMGGRE